MSQYSRRTKAIALAMSLWWVFDTSVLAMQPGLMALSDEELSEENGAGLAFPFENFRLEMEKTSFIQLTGSATNLCDVGSTTTPAGCTTFRRGDLRYYGLSLTRGTSGGPSGTVTTTNVTDWFGNGCTAGTFGLGCPLSTDAIINYSNFDNPFMVRVFNYTGYDTAGTSTSNRPVLEILGPSDMDAFRWSFFGEVESGRTYGAVASNGLYPITGAACGRDGLLTGSACTLQLQNIILGKPATQLRPPTVDASTATNPYRGPALRFFQYAGTTVDTGANPATYGIQYESRLSGNYRMSVNTAGGTVTRGVVPDFTDEEGLYFMNVQAYLPLGQMHYQGIVFDDTQAGSSGVVTTNGNISIELSRIPNVANVYNDFYSCVGGCATADSGYNRVGRSTRYYETHGYVEWGNAFPSNANSNGLGDSGVSQVRYAGADPDGATRVVNSTNFPAATCASNGGVNAVSNSNGTNCTAWSGQTVGNIVFGADTRSNVIAAGGMVFVSKNGTTTWQVTNNQGRATDNTLNMLWVCRPTSSGQCGSSGASWASTVRLEKDARYDGPPGSQYYNPALTINAINLGSSRVNGLLLNHLKLETLGGQ